MGTGIPASPHVSYVASDQRALVVHIVPERDFQAATLCGRTAPRKRADGWYFVAEVAQVIPCPPHIICASCAASVVGYKSQR